MNELVFGKDPTQRIVSVEPGFGDKCVLFIQDENGNVNRKEVPMTHWILYKEHLSSKMKVLEGAQPWKYMIEYESYNKQKEILKACRTKDVKTFIIRDQKESFMIKSGVTMYKGMRYKEVAVLSFDLEHTYGIGDKLKRSGKLLLISNTYRDHKGDITKKLFAYDDYQSEGEMITAWCNWVRQIDPSIVTGHNTFGHDLKVLKFASTNHGVSLKLGRDNSAIRFDNWISKKRKDGSQAYDFNNAHIYGREIVDGFFLALNFDIGRNYESYALKAIIAHEKLERPNRVFYDASKITTNYQDPEEWKKIKDYCIDDSDDSLAVLDLMISPFFYATQSIPRSLQHVINSASGSQINGMMVRGYLQQGHSIAEASDAESFEGAISFAIPGLHKNVQRFDVASLYPSIIRQHKIYNKDKDPQVLFLKMVEYFTLERLENKRLGKTTGERYYKDLEQSQKIIINSMYGFMGAGRVNYNYPEGAAAVTRYGREILKTAILYITGKEFDLDSISNDEDDEDEVA